MANCGGLKTRRRISLSIDEEDGVSDLEASIDGTMGGSGTRERAGSVGPSRKGSISVTLTNPEVLDCPICFMPLSIPVFQCENGHIACSVCCISAKLKNKCPSCCSPIGSNHCWAIEKVLDSITILCQNSKYGCEETTSYSMKDEHGYTCRHAPCLCPFSYCNFVGSSTQLYQHCSGTHTKSAVKFQYNSVLHITLNEDNKFFVLQEEKDDQVLLILENNVKRFGNVISISTVVPTVGRLCLDYDIVARTESKRHTFKFQSHAYAFIKRTSNTARNGVLLVPSYFIGTNGLVQLDIYIWECGLSREQARKIVDGIV